MTESTPDFIIQIKHIHYPCLVVFTRACQPGIRLASENSHLGIDTASLWMCHVFCGQTCFGPSHSDTPHVQPSLWSFGLPRQWATYLTPATTLSRFRCWWPKTWTVGCSHDTWRQIIMTTCNTVEKMVL